MRYFSIIFSLAFILLTTACTTNPVTGKRQFTLMSKSQEIALGNQHYIPNQQSQGGAYEVDPQLTPYVANIGRELSKHSAQPDLPYEFVVLNNPVPNAWALPGGKIAINTGLLVELEDEAQLAAVIGHEIVHAAARHGAEQMATGIGFQILAGVAATQTDNPLYQQAALVSAAGFTAKYGRDNELESDHYGINYMVAAGYDPYAAVELQQTFVRLSEERGQRGSWFNDLFASHPPSRERVAKNKERAQKLPSGKRNKEQYAAATKRLFKDQPAYEKHRKALAAAEKEDWDSALSLTNQAIKLQPKEARFHVTKGYLLNQKNHNKSALTAYNKAVALEPNYYMTRLYRGMHQYKLQNYQAARNDLETSRRLLPTQPANFLLGDLAERNNDYSSAVSYFQQAAKGGGEMGETANFRIKRLSR